ncbi:MAG TPA: CHAD domain-containing protein, partial [Solirubrobacteraceae bacterium]|nr:CHAD domain-containing protein [Solirubrobacteraceae bacterium]
VDERELARAETLGDPVRMALVVADLSACRLRVQTWQEPECRERELLEPAVRRLYGAGRRRFKRVRASKRERAVAMHEWRKRVKDLRYLGEMLQRQPSPPPFALGLPGGGQGRKERPDRESAPLRKLAKRADGLGELLGEEHDLAVLATRVSRSHGGAGVEPHLGGGTRKALLKAISKRRRKLQRQALKQGGRLYATPTKKFVPSTGKVYARAHRRTLRRAGKSLS